MNGWIFSCMTENMSFILYPLRLLGHHTALQPTALLKSLFSTFVQFGR